MREREEKNRVGAMILATFLINIFLMRNQQSCSKTRIEYFNIKIRLLFRETLSGYVKWGRLSKNKCLIIVFVLFSFFCLNT